MKSGYFYYKNYHLSLEPGGSFQNFLFCQSCKECSDSSSRPWLQHGSTAVSMNNIYIYVSDPNCQLIDQQIAA